MRMFVIAALLPLAACQSAWEKDSQAVPATGTGATRSVAATGFTAVELRGSDDVDVTIGPNFAVTAEGQAKVLDQLEITVVDGRLRVGRKRNSGNWNWNDDKGARIHVVMPRLTGASVGGSGNLSVARAEGAFEGGVSGSGDLDIADMQVSAATFAVAGSGTLTAAGRTDKLEVSIAGSGDADLEGLTAKSAQISIAGSGSLNGNVSGPAEVSIVGSGDVTLKGGAQCTVHAVGSGEADCS
ncbi:head GIN domain-containing protein [Sphingomonas sp. CJ20]